MLSKVLNYNDGTKVPFFFIKEDVISKEKKSSSSSKTSGIGFLGALTIAFIVLKLTKVIAWSWWWVWAPLWIPLAIVVGVCIIALIVWGLIAFFIFLDDRANVKKMEKNK